jgi:NAD(P)H-dependent FMN reductase
MPPDARPRLLIIVASTRPTRAGKAIGDWFTQRAIEHDGFAVEVADLLEINLPLMNEPRHPREQTYTHQHTKDWSARVAAADAYCLVMPEYNHSYTAPLKNAIDYLLKEWQYKPVGLVSYGGISGGIRAVQALKPVLTAVRMVPLFEAVVIQFVATLVDEQKIFHPTDHIERSVTPMLNELARQAPVLRQLR